MINVQEMEVTSVEKDGDIFVKGHINHKPFFYTRKRPKLHRDRRNEMLDLGANKITRKNTNINSLKKMKKRRTMEKKKRLRYLTKKNNTKK